ncbi:MAG TPA: hypothetical protein VII75_03515 [Thermoanaerobaculia bacterium]|nr:hypothetical protein [Thermoanaerobaculia bacterium]
MKKLVIIALLLAACASAPPAPPAERIAAAEKELEGMKQVSIHFTTRTTGAVESHFNGTMNVLQGNIASIDADGEMMNKPSTIRWSASGSPSQVSHALIVTLVRMGLTHDLYNLSDKKPPEFLEGGVDDNLKIDHLQWDAKEKKIAYHLNVQKQDVGEGELWLGRHDFPVRRKLTVHFPNGDMKVDEQYEWR